MRRALKWAADSQIGLKAMEHLAEGPLFLPQILFFHGVEESLCDERIQVMQVLQKEFESLIRHLKKRFCFISLDEYCERVVTQDKELARCLMLTFDDGYSSNHRVAAPFLLDEGIPFAVYLTTSAIGTRRRLPTFIARTAVYFTEKEEIDLPSFDRHYSLQTEAARKFAAEEVVRLCKTQDFSKVNAALECLRALMSEDRWGELEDIFHSDGFMTWQQVKELHSAGVVIGAHGHEHIPLHPGLSEEETRVQIVRSRDEITQRFGECRHYAFPNGTPSDISAEAVREVIHAGFQTAATTFQASPAHSVSPWLLPRICTYNVSRLHRLLLRQRLQNMGGQLAVWQQALMTQANAGHIQP